MDSQTYRPAPMSVGLAVISGIVLALGIIGLAALPLLFRRSDNGGWFVGIIALWILIVHAWSLWPRCYEIRDDSIIISRQWPYKSAIIPLKGIEEVKRVQIGKARLVYGSIGLFSDTGWFRNKEFGKFFMSVTDPDKAVMLSNDSRYVLSPKYPDEFVADLKHIINQV
ncbi:MAG TPA: PH domain-containing protein [Armatimonadota bacterium]|nr:PH domain-containing protein [Armatimonadota bacterium]